MLLVVTRLVHRACLVVHRADQRVFRKVAQVPLELEPRASGRDVVRRALAADTEQAAQRLELKAAARRVLGPEWRRERLQRLKALARGVDHDAHIRLRRGHRLGGHVLVAGGKALRGEHVALWRCEAELGAARRRERVGHRVKVEASGKCKRGNELWRGQKVERVRVAVVAPPKVAVERREDHVCLALVLGAAPLADARATRIREDARARVGELLLDAVALDRRADLLTAWRDVKAGARSKSRVRRLAREVRAAAHVRVAAVRTAADERGGELDGVRAVWRTRARDKLGQRHVEVGRERAIEARLELAEVNLDHAVVLCARVGLEEHGRGGARGLCNILAAGRREVRAHRVAVRERGRGRADLGAHVAHRRQAGRRQRPEAVAKVLDDKASAAAHRELAGEVQDHVLCRAPRRELPLEVHAQHARRHQLPRRRGHRVDSIRATDADREAPEAGSVRRVRVGAEHEHAWRSVVLQHGLVDDARAGAPELDAVLA